MPEISVRANIPVVTGLEDDTALVKALEAFAGMPPSRMATEAGLALTTLTRPASGKATTRIGRVTLDKLKARWPDFPGWRQAPPPPNAVLAPPMEGASLARMREDVPIWGTAMGAIEVIDGEAIEQTTLNTGEVIAYAKRPTILDGRADIYALYVQGSSMAPRHEEGDTIFVETKRTPRTGDDVVVYVRPASPDDDGERASSVYVKRLVRSTGHFVELEQFTPALAFKIERDRVLRVHRVVPWRELI